MCQFFSRSFVVDKRTHFPSIGSDDPPPPPLGVEKVKIRENSEKIGGPPVVLGTLYNPF